MGLSDLYVRPLNSGSLSKRRHTYIPQSERHEIVSPPAHPTEVLMIDDFDSFTWNLYQSLFLLRADAIVIRNDAISLKNFPDLQIRSLVVSSGPVHPQTDASVSQATMRYFMGSGSANHRHTQSLHREHRTDAPNSLKLPDAFPDGILVADTLGNPVDSLPFPHHWYDAATIQTFVYRYRQGVRGLSVCTWVVSIVSVCLYMMSSRYDLVVATT